MTFTSWQYAFFLLVVVLLYWQLPYRGRILLLLAGSYAFYGFWDARFLALLMTSTAIDYSCGLAISLERSPLGKVVAMSSLPLLWLAGCAGFHLARCGYAVFCAAAFFPLAFSILHEILWRLPRKKMRHAFVLLSVITNLGVLGFFKYFNFFIDSAAALLRAAGMHPSWVSLNIILPVGISFYTFQSICYAVDIYKGKAKPVKSAVTFAAYLSFFPQLVAGPIERPGHLVPQFEKAAEWDWAHIHRGVKLILIGLFKKIFVADNCALVANYAFDPTTVLNGYWAVIGVLAFAFQIYGDFSGYTDIARGSAQMLGIRLSSNFRFPYVARGPSDFWNRWHITLSSWFRDYVYIPLGGNRCGRFLTLRNLFATMLLAGLWHGANWTYILWGAYYGVLLVLYRTVPFLRRLESNELSAGPAVPASRALMFGLTLLGWAIFRSANMEQLGGFLEALGRWHMTGKDVPWTGPLFWVLIHALPLGALQWASRTHGDVGDLDEIPWMVRGVTYALMFILVASSSAGEKEFIYFQF